MTSRDWGLYDEWNAEIARRLYAADKYDVPVYIDVDSSVLEACGGELGVSPKQSSEQLLSAVRSTMGLAGTPLEEHFDRFQKWRQRLRAQGVARSKRTEDGLEPPPVIALLTVLVMAAERMGSDSSVAAHAYYARLDELLGLTTDEGSRLKGRFWITEFFWRGLNEYLDQNEGRVGLPTAYALGHRYVGLPQSQALMRAGDRAKLPEFFQLFGLAPGSQLIPADLERLLDAWIRTTPSPVSANLQRLWKSAAVKERISGVVAVELAHWDGTLRGATPSGATRLAGALRLTALLQQTFGGIRLELSLLARFATQSQTTTLRVVSAECQPVVGVIPTAGGRLRPTPGSRLDAASLTGANVEVEDPSSGERISRNPRRVVPFRRDDLVGTLVEVDRIELAEDVVLLVRDDTTLVNEVQGLIQQYGRLGAVYSAGTEALPGLPDGWALFADVQLYAIPQSVQRLELQVLVPLSTAQLSIWGGLKLPGRIRKWSSLQPPEIRAVVAEAETLRLSIVELGEERLLLEEWTDSTCAMVKRLADLDLDDGDYEVEMFVNHETRPIAASTLRLRSSDTPDVVSWETCTRLNYELDSGALVAVSAVAATDKSDLVVDGLKAFGSRSTPVAVTQTAPSGLGWTGARTGRGDSAPPLVLGAADPNSCMVTGRHYMVLPTYTGGKATGRIEGRCRSCGVVKTYPARPKWKTQSTSPPEPRLHLVDLPEHPEASITWDTCLDALVHVGGGDIFSLERVATQFEASSLFIDTFVRTLETLGHIDVRRDESMQPVEWEANPAYLAETASGSFVLAGVWGREARRILVGAVEAAGGELHVEPIPESPATWRVQNLSAEALVQVMDRLPVEGFVVPTAVTRMLDVLPPLSEVERALPSIAMPDYRSASIFDTARAEWRPTPGVGIPGAYRLDQSFRRLSVWVNPQDSLQRRARLGTVQLVKHLAALHRGQPLIGYLEKTQTLIVPLGADLPGLYGRAAALCSGRMPQIGRSARALAYPQVPRWVADRLTTLLCS